MKGIYTTTLGLRVVYISTPEDHSDANSSLPASLLSEALAAEDIGFIGVDLLLTYQWPSGVDRHLFVPLPEECVPCSKTGSLSISNLAFLLRPRYHFSSGGGYYYERAPYRNHRVLQEKASHVTRFIALSEVRNPHNRKYLYALQLTPIDKMPRADLTSQPPDVTENPYRDILEHKSLIKERETEVQTEQYFYQLPEIKTEQDESGRKRGRRASFSSPGPPKKSAADSDSDSTSAHEGRLIPRTRTETLQEKLEKPREQAACWFCLGNPQVKKHLIISVNTQAYLALPRGPLVTDHVLILTVGHHRSWTACPDYVRGEIEDYKNRLRRMYKSEGKAMVAFERNLKTQHYQLQVVPVPFAVAGEVKHAFLDTSAKSDTSPCVLKPIPKRTELSEICPPGIPYFYVELPTGEKLFGQIKKDRIPTSDIQFGRYVLCDKRILNCPEKADWRDCTDDVEKETELTAKMREKFAPYDVN
ncbi:unnamed protein product [Calicophoron daubneyi]